MAGKRISTFLLAFIMVMTLSGCSDFVLAASEDLETEAKKIPGNRLEMVQEAGKIMIGISPDYAPFEFSVRTKGEDGLMIAGADVELGKYIAERLGVEAEFCKMEFEDCFQAVSEGSVDMVLLGMLPGKDREKWMDFTECYYQPGRQVMLVRRNQAEKLKESEDFEERTIAAQYGSLQAQLVSEQFPGSYMKLADNASETILMLRVGNVDGAVLDEALTEQVLQEHPDVAVSGIEISCNSEGVVGGVVKGEEELLAQINSILAKVREEKLYFKWLDAANELARKE